MQLKNYEVFFYQLLKLEDLKAFCADLMDIIRSSVNRTLKGSLGEILSIVIHTPLV